MLTLLCIRRSSLSIISAPDPSGLVAFDRNADYDLLWFGSALRALEVAREIVQGGQEGCAAGVSTGDTSSAEGSHRLLSEATGTANLAEPGQILVCLSTQEITRSSIDEKLTFTAIGHRELDSGLKSFVFLVDDVSGPNEFAPFDHSYALAHGDFVGRSAELAQVAEKLGHSRFVNIAGPSGIGKTSLAARFSTEYESDDTGRVIWMDLEDVRQPALFIHRVAAALQISYLEESTLVRQITKNIDGRDLLMVLDGIDDIVEAVLDFAGAVLPLCPNLCFLATSTKRINHAAVEVILLEGLDFPSPFERLSELVEFDAVRLLTSWARKVDPSFVVSDRTASDVAYIVNILEGSPMAIKMVASRFGILSAKQVMSRLTDDPLGFLVDGKTSGGSIRSALAATLSTLNPWSARLFARMWVFSGSFDADAVESICVDGELPKGAILDALKDLYEGYLIVPSWRPSSSRVFRLSQVCREFSKSLATAEERRFLLANQAKHLKRLETEFWPNGLPSGAVALETFDLCYEDLRALWLRQVKSPTTATQAIESLVKSSNFWIQKLQYEEGYSVIRKIAEEPCAVQTLQFVPLLNVGAWCATKMGDYGTARKLSRMAMRLALQREAPLDQAKILNTLCGIFADLGRTRSALRCAEAAVKLFDGLGEMELKAVVQSNLAGLLTLTGRFDEAEKLFNAGKSGRGSRAWADVSYFGNLAYLEACRENWELARAHLREACDLCHEFPYIAILPALYLTGAQIALGEGRYYDLYLLIAALQDLVDHFDLVLPPRRRREMDRLAAAVGGVEKELAPQWNGQRPLERLEQSLISSI